MGVRLPNERMDASDPALPVFETKGERTIASSANQPGGPEGMVLPWLMTMPSPREDIKIGNIGARWDEKLETAQPFSVPEGPTQPLSWWPCPRSQVPFLRGFRRQARMALCHPIQASPG
jgi:hypothetical protein